MSVADISRGTRPAISDVADRAVSALQRSSDVCVMAQAATDVAVELVAGVVAVDVSVVTASEVIPIARSPVLSPEHDDGAPRTAVSLELDHEICTMTFWFDPGAVVDDTVELHALLIAALLEAAAPFATSVVEWPTVRRS